MNEKTNKWEKLVDVLVDSLGYIVVRFAPVIAPVPSIAKILEASGYSMNAWVSVIAIELVGYAIGDKMVKAVQEDVLDMRKASIPILAHAIIIEGLMVGYVVAPTWSYWHDGLIATGEAIKSINAMFYPLLTIAGAGLYAFHEYLINVQSDKRYDKEVKRQRDQVAWEDDREYKIRERDARLAVKYTVKSPVKPDVQVAPESTAKTGGSADNAEGESVKSEADERREKLLSILQSLDGQPAEKLNKSELSRLLKVSRPTINADIAALQDARQLTLNGHVMVSKKA